MMNTHDIVRSTSYLMVHFAKHCGQLNETLRLRQEANKAIKVKTRPLRAFGVARFLIFFITTLWATSCTNLRVCGQTDDRRI